ncbi:MAG TPA: hypothetical protein VHY91_04150 [Pirellulales bacterium]|nr:hypothetical protein [Pirellulales bacterium]
MLLALDRSRIGSGVSDLGLTIRIRRVLVILIAAAVLLGSGAAPVFADGPLRAIATALPESIKKVPSPRVMGDRFEYWADDPIGQFVAIGAPAGQPAKGSQLRITLRPEDAAGERAAPIASIAIPELVASSFSIDMAQLAVGRYVVEAILEPGPGAPVAKGADFHFAKTDRRTPPIAFPADGVPLDLEPQSHLADTVWPVRCGVPLPLGTVTDTSRLVVLEDGQRILAQITERATWHAGGSVKWIHVDFLGRYRNGKPARYRLALLPATPPALKTPLKCQQTEGQITVDTGAVRFVVDRRRFKGVETAWVAPKQDGRYDLDHPIVSGSGGPYVVDGRLIRFDAANDQNVRVEIEEQGPQRVTIVASGWYVNPEGRVEPISMFKTRITAFAGQPLVRVSHHTIITFDTRMQRLADVGFEIGVPGATRYRWGYDGEAHSGDLPPAPQAVGLHQYRYDHLRVLGVTEKSATGKTSDGWFSALGPEFADPAVHVLLRDVWQKFPKEVELSRGGVALHFWPKHGVRAFQLQDELARANIYKFWCFHQNSLLDLNLPSDYYDRLSNQYRDETFECRPEHALNGNGQGLAIGNEFALLFRPTAAAKSVPAEAAMFQEDPTALCDPRWNAATGAMGKIAAADHEHFGELEQAMEQGFLSYSRSVERGREYGMWNYADTHTIWHVAENRADLHRVWQNSHYHEVGTSWLMTFRTASSALLRWARKCTDHYMNVDTINYARHDQPLKGHLTAGCMYHCKSLTHWGSEAYGMFRRDGHGDLWGHWVDPDAFLWSWYIDGNARAKDVYDMWAEGIRTYGLPLAGTRREVNTSLAIALTYYQSSWDPAVLPFIIEMGHGLRWLEPLEKQNPGPLWHPLWINRYYAQTRDPDYPEFVLKYARMPQMGNTWTLALAALAFDLSGDVTYLTQHRARLNQFSKLFYRAKNDPYDWYGVGPGPLGSDWAFMSWPTIAAALPEAAITSLDRSPDEVEGQLPLALADPKNPKSPPSALVLALKSEDRPFDLNLEAVSLGGDLVETNVRVIAPSGKLVHEIRIPRTGASTYRSTENLPADGEIGMYRVEIRCREAAVTMPLTNLEAEASLWPKNQVVRGQWLAGDLLLTEGSSPIELKIEATNDVAPLNYRLTAADGKVVAAGSLFKSRDHSEARVMLDPARHPMPWRLEVVGRSALSWRGQGTIIWGQTPDGLDRILSGLERFPRPGDPNRK